MRDPYGFGNNPAKDKRSVAPFIFLSHDRTTDSLSNGTKFLFIFGDGWIVSESMPRPFFNDMDPRDIFLLDSQHLSGVSNVPLKMDLCKVEPAYHDIHFFFSRVPSAQTVGQSVLRKVMRLLLTKRACNVSFDCKNGLRWLF